MSQKIKEKAAELASREAEIKRNLLGQSKNAQSKATRIGKTAIYGGLVTLLIYMIYKSFRSDREEKSEKTLRPRPQTSGIITEKVVTFGLAYLGKFLDRYLEETAKKKKAQSDVPEE